MNSKNIWVSELSSIGLSNLSFLKVYIDGYVHSVDEIKSDISDEFMPAEIHLLCDGETVVLPDINQRAHIEYDFRGANTEQLI